MVSRRHGIRCLLPRSRILLLGTVSDLPLSLSLRFIPQYDHHSFVSQARPSIVPDQK